MDDFIVLSTNFRTDKILLNKNHIVSVKKAQVGELTNILAVDGIMFIVDETVDEVIELLIKEK